MGLGFENEEELKPKPSSCSSQKLVSGLVGKGDERKTTLAVVGDGHQAPPSMGFSRQEYWSGVPLPSPFKVLTLHLSVTSNNDLTGMEWVRFNHL